MLLRPRQKLFVERSVSALSQHGNTLAVAPTGAGKTIMLSAVAGRMIADPDAKACVLAHRDELTDQNRDKFRRVVPGLSTSVVDAREKSWNGQVTFAMVPTLARSGNLDGMPTLDLLVIDEAHHAAADSYRRIIDQALKSNPACRIYGVTATPTRGKLVWTSGVNNGLAVEIKAHSSSAGVSRIAIALPMGAPVLVGDTFSATAGCDRTFATCRNRFANTVNFGGFPHMPGTDFAMSYPNQGAGNDGGKIT